ncbi:hypothetical protein L9G16_16195 [Shewanella sp. A25]|nr:hypothetical protein [Shewanella shenzhenensis]
MSFLVSYFLFFQFMIMLSFWLGIDQWGGLGDVFSYYRPTMLLIISIGLLNLLEDLDNVFDTIVSFLKLFVTINFLYSIIEVFLFSQVSSILNLLYRMEDKSNISGVAVSFFSLPYYHSYILCTTLPFLISNYRLNKKPINFMFILMCLSSIILSQSKVGVFLSIGIVFYYYFLLGRVRVKWLVLSFFSLFSAFSYYYLSEFVSYLNSEFGGNFARTLHLMLSNTKYAYNLLERLDDITDTIRTLYYDDSVVGLGLAKGKTIEIWIAMILYRYGILGFFVFIIFFAGLAFFSYKAGVSQTQTVKGKEVCISITIWSSTIFISQLSGLMMETSKASAFSMLMLAISAVALFPKQKVVN